MRRSHKALLAEAADALVFGGVIGAPAEKPERKARTPKAKAKAQGAKSKREDNVTRLETPNVQRAPSIEEEEETSVPERVDDAYQKVFQALNTQGLESLLATQNDKLDKILLVLLRWWKWDRDQLREMIVESKKRQRLAQLEQTQAENAARQAQQGGGSGGGFLEAMSDLFGGGADVDLPNGPDGKKRKRRTRRQRTRPAGRGGRFGGMWRRTVERAKTYDGKVRNAPRAFANKVDDLVRAGGSRAMSALSSGGKLATLLGAGGALVYSGALNEGEDDLVRRMHEEEAEKQRPKPKPKAATTADVADDLTPATVKRTAQEAVEEVDATAKAAKPNVKTPDLPKSAEKGMFSKIAKAGKGVGNAVKSNAIISSAFAALDAYNIASDDTMTDKEKEKAYSGLAGSSAGGILGGMGAAAIGAAIGQVLIPIPGVGAAVGGAVAGIAGSYFGSEAGQAAGEMTYDIVVTQRDGEKASEEQDAAIKVDVKSPAIDKIAEAADKQERTTGNWFTRTFGSMFSAKTGPQSTPSNYAMGGASSYAFSGGGSNYSYQTRNPAAGASYNGGASTSSVSKIDYTSDPRYVQGQGVLKNLANSDKVEARLSNWSGLIEDKANKHGVDPLLVRSIMKQESGGKNDARSHAGAAGLMQLMPNTARGLGVNDSHDPSQNVEGGTKYISQMIKMFDGNVPVALAAYNWGPGNMQKLIKRTGTTDINQLMPHLPAETRGYVTNITRNHSQYKAQLDAQQAAETAKATDTKSTVDVARTDATTTERDTSEVKVDRTDTSDNIVAATSPAQVNVTVPPPAPDKKAKVKSATKESQKPPAMLARQGGASPTTLDDMPILIADHGLGSLLSGRI